MGDRKIKIWAIVLVLLTAAALVFVLSGASSLKATADQVKMEQRESYGDPSALEGVTAVFRNYATGTGSICWQTELSRSGGKETVKTSHSYSQNQPARQNSFLSADIEINCYLDDCPSIQAYAEKLAADADWTQNWVQVKLSDFMEYVPLTATYSVGNQYFDSLHTIDADSGHTVLTDEVNSVLRELFRIKASQGSITIRIIKDSNKNSVSVSYNTEQYGSSLFAYLGLINGAYYDGAFYIYDYVAIGESDHYAKLDTLPDGSTPYKIYRIPVISEYNKTSKSEHYLLDVDNITVCGEYAEGFRILSSSRISDGSRVIVLGVEGNRLKAVMIDMAAGGKVSEVDICEKTDAFKNEVYNVMFRDDCMIMDIPGEGYYVVYPENGSCKLFFAPTDGSVEALELKRYQYDRYNRYKLYNADFRNGKLAVACFAGEEYEYHLKNGTPMTGFRPSGMSLAVYTEDGLKYFTRYNSSVFEIDSVQGDIYTNSIDVLVQ